MIETDVLIAGFGPTGATLAALLGQAGVQDASSIDRDREVYRQPRAAHFDHEIMRIWQKLGIAEAVLPLDARDVPIRIPQRRRRTAHCASTSAASRRRPAGRRATCSTNRRSKKRCASASPTANPSTDPPRRDARSASTPTTPTGVDARRSRSTASRRRVRARYLDRRRRRRQPHPPRCIDSELFDYGFDEPWLVIDTLVQARRRPAALRRPDLRSEAPDDRDADGPAPPPLGVHAASPARRRTRCSTTNASPTLLAPWAQARPSRDRAQSRLPLPRPRREDLARRLASCSPATPRTRCRRSWVKACAPASATPTTSPGSSSPSCAAAQARACSTPTSRTRAARAPHHRKRDRHGSRRVRARRTSRRDARPRHEGRTRRQGRNQRPDARPTRLARRLPFKEPARRRTLSASHASLHGDRPLRPLRRSRRRRLLAHHPRQTPRRSPRRTSATSNSATTSPTKPAASTPGSKAPKPPSSAPTAMSSAPANRPT